MKCNCISFLLHINTCLYVHNAIVVSAYIVRVYVNRRKCLLCKDLGAGPRPKSLRSKGLYQLYLLI
jgi:hypothetical protein